MFVVLSFGIPKIGLEGLDSTATDQCMSSKTKLVVALTGMAVVLICELVAVFDRALATTSPAFLSGFAVLSALGFWAMSFHRLGR